MYTSARQLGNSALIPRSAGRQVRRRHARLESLRCRVASRQLRRCAAIAERGENIGRVDVTWVLTRNQASFAFDVLK